MCSVKKPKAQPTPPPPQMQTTATEDEAVLRESQRERRRAASRYGRQATIMAGAASGGMPPTGQTKTLLGSNNFLLPWLNPTSHHHRAQQIQRHQSYLFLVLSKFHQRKSA